MKKLIALLLVLILCLSSCDVVGGLIGNLGNNGGLGNGDNNGIIGGDDNDIGYEGDCDGINHTDVNDDGYCDGCLESVIVIIDLFALNDLHGKITETSSQPGIAGLTTYLKKMSNDNTVFFSTGDMWQGSSESNLTHGALITDWMNEL